MSNYNARKPLERLVCWLLRHDHTRVYIMLTMREGRPMVSPLMDRWSADLIIANEIAATAMWAGREVASCRIVVP